MTHNKELTKVLPLSLTPSEIKELEEISKQFFGKANKSGMVRYWITKNSLKNCKSDGKLVDTGAKSLHIPRVRGSFPSEI